jgi:hypothetical protein
MIFFRGEAARVDLEIIDVAVNNIDKSWFSKLLWPWLTRCLLVARQSDISFYGHVIVYGMCKKNILTAS